jgi:hypothetical protein
LAIELNPQYVKAYCRLSSAYQKMDDKESAKKILQQGLKVAEDTGDHQMVSVIKDELRELNGSAGGMGGMGDFDLGSIMNNPMFAQMAQQMMSNPQMMESMLGSLGGAGGAGGINPGAMFGGEGANSGPGGIPEPPAEMRDKIERLKNDPKFAVSLLFIYS